MQSSPAIATSLCVADLSGLVATLCLTENWLGPYHPRTLRLLAEVGRACWLAGQNDCGRLLLERAVRDSSRYLGPDHSLRLRAIADLRDLLTEQGEHDAAVALQNELRRCEGQTAVLQ